MTIGQLNNLGSDALFEELFKCCGSTKWAKTLCAEKPFAGIDDLMEKSDRIWSECSEKDGLEAFTHHPKIGDLKSLEKKFAATKEWAGGEQAGVNSAGNETLIALADGNEAYEKKFGYIFIVCATGKTADEMLNLLSKRLTNEPSTELKTAMHEQNKITYLRMKKLLT